MSAAMCDSLVRVWYIGCKALSLGGQLGFTRDAYDRVDMAQPTHKPSVGLPKVAERV